MIRGALVLLGAMILSAGLARAEGGYVGAGAGRTSLKETSGIFTFSGTDSAVKVFAGYRFGDFLGIEGSYLDLGSPEDTTSGFRRKTSVSGLDLYAVGVLPLGPAEVFAKAGFVAWNTETTTSGVVPASTAADNGTGAAYGAGAAVKLGAKLRARLEWEAFDVRGTDRVTLASVGLDWRF